MVLYPLAALRWVMAAADINAPRWRRALLALIPGLPPVALSALPFVDADAAVMAIIGNWSLTILSPLLSLGGAAWILSGRKRRHQRPLAIWSLRRRIHSFVARSSRTPPPPTPPPATDTAGRTACAVSRAPASLA